MGDQCSISAGVADGSAPDLTIAKGAVDQGLTVVLPDYQGLGTPGDHAYLVGQAEGRNVLDGIRAATHLDGSGATPDSKAVVWGHSQGGQAAAFTAELQPTYAPDVHLVGAVAGAPASDLTGAGPQARGQPRLPRLLPDGRRRPPGRLPGAGGGRPAAHATPAGRRWPRSTTSAWTRR